jgi:hypothetical protein
VNPTTPDLNQEQKLDIYPDSVAPGPGGTSLHLVTFRPSSSFSDPSSDGEAPRKESLGRLPGLADHFEKEDPAMHKTNTVDCAVVFEGEVSRPALVFVKADISRSSVHVQPFSR